MEEEVRGCGIWPNATLLRRVSTSLPKRSDFLGLWSAIGLFGANWSEKGPILRSKVRFFAQKSDFEGLSQHQLVHSAVLLPIRGTAEFN